MDFKELLLSKHSKVVTNNIVQYIGDSPVKFKLFLDVFKDQNPILIQRAAWPLGYIGEQQPQLIIPHLKTILKNTQQPWHVAYKRNVFRVLCKINQIPATFHSEVFNLGLLHSMDLSNPTAVRAFAMQVATKIALIYPELKQELIPHFEYLSMENSPAIKSSLKHCQIKLNKLKND